MPSDDIFKLQKQIPYVFKGAEYIQCNKYQLKSYALFKLPANIDNVQDGKAVDEQVINLAYFPNETGARDLTVYIPPKLKNSINELVKSNVYISSSDILISLIIDSEGKSLSFTVIGAYIDKKPVQLEKYDSNGDKFMITIPSYGLEKMLGQSDEAFIVLVNVKQKK